MNIAGVTKSSRTTNFPLPSSSSAYRLLHATIFPSAEIVQQTSAGL
jgi:hypothetical protein